MMKRKSYGLTKEKAKRLSLATEEAYLQFLYDLDNPIKIEIAERDLKEGSKKGIEMLKIKYNL